MSNAIYLDEMREHVGRAIYGGDLIERLSKDEWSLLRNHGPARTSKRRADGTFISHIEKCPKALRSELDRLLGRWTRWNAQNDTIDSWIQDHGCPMEPKQPVDRASFFAALKSAQPASLRPRGRSGSVIERVKADMKEEVMSGRISLEKLAGMDSKTLPPEFKASWGTVRKARELVVSELSNIAPVQS